MDIKLILAAGVLGGITFVSLVYKSKSSEKDSIKQVSLNELAQNYSDKIDRMIIKELRETGNEFVSSVFTISYSEEKRKIPIDADLYFQNPEKEWLKKNSQDLLKSNILSNQELNELIANKEIKYELTAPEELVKYSS